MLSIFRETEIRMNELLLIISLAILPHMTLGQTHMDSVSMRANAPGTGSVDAQETDGVTAGHRHRVIVSTDIGGTDPDDFQSMVHLLLYADVLDIEGLVSSPFDQGRKEDILKVIDCYANDYPNLRTYSDKYPTADALRAMTKQGETERAPYAGVRQSTEGSEWIAKCARRDDPRPLHILVWGLIEDLAQALHDAPDILPKLRVYWIGGPNKKWSPDAYQYIVNHHPELWIIESNATYRGWFVGGNQSGEWGNMEFVTRHIAGKGALGDFFVSKKADIKMGDTPSVGWLLKGTPDDPSQPGWGGRFARAWERPYIRFDRLTTKDDRMEIFGILELTLPLGDGAPDKPEARFVVDNQSLPGHTPGDGTMRFRFCPKSKKTYSYKISGNVPALDGKAGRITVDLPKPEQAAQPSAHHLNWWTDDPDPAVAQGNHHGAKTVSRWREEFLRDFAVRMKRCTSPASR
jgi:Cellulose-binding Sde182, nucleoside hydrolase-like domain